MRRPLANAARFRFLLAMTIALLATAAPAAAQYLYLDTNGDGVSTSADVVAPTGATTLHVWIRTDQNRDGSPALCSSADGALSINGYQIVLRATNGTVAWSSFTNQRPEFAAPFGSGSDATEIAGGFYGGTQLAPGGYLLASVEVSVATGTPAIDFVPVSALSGGAFLTAFTSACSGLDLDYTLKLGGDFQDADGAPYGGTPNASPELAPIPNVVMREGESYDAPLVATDANGDPVVFALVTGPPWASVATTDPGSGTAAGVVHLTPGYSDAGPAVVTVSAADALSATTASFLVTVEEVNRPPVLSEPEMISVSEGDVADGGLQAVDPDGDAATFFLITGPTYLTVSTVSSELGASFGLARAAPGFADAGMTMALIGARDAGGATDTTELMVMVRDVNRAPILTVPPTLSGFEGERIAFTASATDADGDMVNFEALGLPAGATFVDLMNSTAPFRWTPGYDQAGTYTVTIVADDHHGSTESASVAITVEDVAAAVALAQPDDVLIGEGQTAEQTLTAFDASGDPLTFALVSGPSYASVSTTDAGTGIASGRLRIAPGMEDAGLATVTVSVSDGTTTAQRTLQVEVLDAGSIAGATPFVPPFPVLGVGLTPHTVTMGDVNQDGILDLVTANLGSNTVSVMLGTGDGLFAMRMDVSTLIRPHTVAVHDLNGDGIPDLAFTHTGSNSIGIAPGLGDGMFGVRQDIPVGGSPLFLAIDDFNRDGIPDIAGTNQTTGALLMLLGAGGGAFLPGGEFPTGTGAHGMVIGDMNADGKTDAAVANHATVSVLLGKGDGTFEPKRDFPTSAPHTVALGDVDGDGKKDLVVSNLSTGTITLALGNGDGTFLPQPEIPTGASVHASAIGDLDGDGIVEVLSANQGANTLSVMMGRPGGLAPKVDFGMSAGPHSIAIGDLDGDEKPDVAVSSIVGNTVTVLLNKTLPPLRAARAFVRAADRRFVVPGRKPALSVSVEPVAEGFQVEDIDPASVELVSEGTGSVARVAALAKDIAVSDRDGNGIADAAFAFATPDLKRLFDQIQGRRIVEVAVEGALVGGGGFRGTFELEVVAGAPEHAVSVAPNPLNPVGKVSFTVERAGPVSVAVYDVQGRIVRRLLEARTLPAGRHEVPIGEAGGRPLASGVYFVKVTRDGGSATARFTVLK